MMHYQGTLAGMPVKTVYDYVQDGVLHINNEARSVLVTAESDLAQLDGYLPGSIAFTAGYASMWMLDASGSWVSMTADTE